MSRSRISLKSPGRGEVYLVNFDPTIRSEIKKTRPAVILQNDIANRYSPVTVVAAITSYQGGEMYPTEVLIRPPEGGVLNDSLVLLNQIRTIDKRRLTKRLGRLAPATMEQVGRAIEVSLGLVDSYE